MYKKNIGLKLTTIILGSLLAINVAAQNWNIPADQSAKNSSFPFNASTAKEGEAIFTKNCVSCHGNPGKGNSLKSLSPIPPDLAGAVTQHRTDGDIFYIISTGRVIMPSFKDVLTDQDRWKVISYIRSFNKDYVQVLSKFDSGKSKLVKITMEFDAKTNQIKVLVKANETTGVVSLKNDEVELFAKRYFGKLQIDKTNRTDANGLVVFSFPKDLPGDKNGNVDLIVSVNDDSYGEVQYQKVFKVGVPTNKPSLTEKRAIWNVLAKAPVWLILTYLFCVFLVLSVFGYIVYNLFKLNKSSDIKNLKS
ncbi:MAG: cytochrome c [Paludibacter sp.]|nr:cytochrome c [Paludibacter sp.]